MMNHIKQHFMRLFADRQLRTSAFLLFSLGLVLISMEVAFNHKTVESGSSEAAPFSPDTVIPAGFTLVPLELANADALGSMIGGFAIVDLFTPALPGHTQGKKVGHHLRLIRAPLNPKIFGVLVPENESALLMSTPGPYVAVVLNRNIAEQGQMTKTIAKPKIQYYSEDGK